MSIIELDSINKYYGEKTSKVHVLKNINFTANKGELVLVLGPSGSGKSTFLTIIGGLLTPSDGTVLVNNKIINNLDKKQKEKLRLNQIGFILQTYNLVPYLTVREQFKLVDKVKKNNIENNKFKVLLQTLGIEELLDKYPKNLSGGQNQRVAIARALYANPEIILADEPTAALDSKRVEEVGLLFKNLAQNNKKAVIIVTHDLRLKEFADKVYEIEDGKIKLS